jgi:hypothetical protein
MLPGDKEPTKVRLRNRVCCKKTYKTEIKRIQSEEDISTKCASQG